ncbi:MAG: hypothetical protein HWD61_02960 [Parachlamydiaceae bacterium]|nr:MAG: hypothetical protein HWD61_02960 [Parachlamydiaceae bacterium]
MKRSDWYEQAFDIVEGTDENQMNQFISDKMIERFKTQQDQIIKSYQKEKLPNGWVTRFIQSFIESTIRNHLKNENYLEIARFVSIDFPIDVREMLKSLSY